jgi:hypothetical protein
VNWLGLLQAASAGSAPGNLSPPFADQIEADMSTGSFECVEARGEAWLYKEGDRQVMLEIGLGVAGTCGVHTSGVTVQAGSPLTIDEAVAILAKFMVFMGGPSDGFSRLVLSNDGKYDLTQPHVDLIDRQLRPLGFQLESDAQDTVLTWVKKKHNEADSLTS